MTGQRRLIEVARKNVGRLYSADQFSDKSISVSADYLVDLALPVLRHAVTQEVRLRAARARLLAKSKRPFETSVSSPAAAIVEALFDKRWFRTKTSELPRLLLRDKVNRLLTQGRKIELVIPLFSRKPISPIKNRGRSPDSAELHSLARLATLALMVDDLSPTGCQLTVLADGLNFNHACLTPNEAITSYQRQVRALASALDCSRVLQVVDHEAWLTEKLGEEIVGARAKEYHKWESIILSKYHNLFDPSDPKQSLEAVGELDKIGALLSSIFWSVATSVSYRSFTCTGICKSSPWAYCCDDMVYTYCNYVASLPDRLLKSYPDAELFYLLRQEAWEATCRYASVILRDREVGAVREAMPHGVKLTIRGKPGELNFITTGSRDANITAQHSTGGYRLQNDAAEPSYRYVIEREAEGETPVLVSDSAQVSKGQGWCEPLRILERFKQPFAYVNNRAPVEKEELHTMFRSIDL